MSDNKTVLCMCEIKIVVKNITVGGHKKEDKI